MTLPRQSRVAYALVTLAAAGAAYACAAVKEETTTPVPTDGARLYRLPDKPVCAEGYAGAREVGTVGDADLLEASGIVTSALNHDVLWLHNDSGDTARVFAMATDGTPLGRLTLPDIDARDIEDIATGPCPDLQGPCLFLADTGDNKHEHDKLYVYAFPEPDVAPDRPLPEGATTSRVWTFPMVVPDEKANIEAMVVTPGGTAMIFFEKSFDDSRVLLYRAPWIPDVDAVLEVTDTFTPPGQGGPRDALVTGADLHPSGRRLALRTYGGVYEQLYADDANGGPHLELLDESAFVEVPTLEEPQGEAVAYDEAGTGVWTVSESPTGAPHPPLHHSACRGTP